MHVSVIVAVTCTHVCTYCCLQLSYATLLYYVSRLNDNAVDDTNK